MKKKYYCIVLFLLVPNITLAIPNINAIKQQGIIDYQQIIKVYNKAKAGDAFSQADLGESLVNGSIGMLPNYSRGLYWLQKSAKQNCALAYFGLATLYFEGNGVPRDMTKFYQYTEKALKIYNRELAQNQYTPYQLAMLRYKVATLYFWGVKDIVKQDLPKAFALFKQSAEDGFVHSIKKVALMYHYGMGAEKNLLEAHKWYLLLAEAGWVPAQHIIGLDYLQGDVVKYNQQEGIKWISKAALAGYYPAVLKLVDLQKQGLTTPGTFTQQNILHVLQKVSTNLATVMRRNPMIRI